MPFRTISVDQLGAFVGQEIGLSGWVEASQSRIDMFADATLDHQFIHVDPEQARSTHFGGTIAHGFLSLSLLSWMSFDALPQIEGTEMGVNYGFNNIRFLTPVNSGKRIRGRFFLRGLTDKRPGRILLNYDVTVEIENEAKPAFIAEWLVLLSIAGGRNPIAA